MMKCNSEQKPAAERSPASQVLLASVSAGGNAMDHYFIAIVEKYGGTISFQADEGMFNVNILLPLSA